MQNFKAHRKTAQRRVTFLEDKLSDKNKRSNSWDKAELSSLQALLRVANVYEDSRDDGGSHIENILYMARDVLKEVHEENTDVLHEDALERLEHAQKKCTEGIEFLHRMSDEAETA